MIDNSQQLSILIHIVALTNEVETAKLELMRKSEPKRLP